METNTSNDIEVTSKPLILTSFADELILPYLTFSKAKDIFNTHLNNTIIEIDESYIINYITQEKISQRKAVCVHYFGYTVEYDRGETFEIEFHAKQIAKCFNYLCEIGIIEYGVLANPFMLDLTPRHIHFKGADINSENRIITINSKTLIDEKYRQLNEIVWDDKDIIERKYIGFYCGVDHFFVKSKAVNINALNEYGKLPYWNNEGDIGKVVDYGLINKVINE